MIKKHIILITILCIGLVFFALSRMKGKTSGEVPKPIRSENVSNDLESIGSQSNMHDSDPIYAAPEDVIALANRFIELDPSLSNDWERILAQPDKLRKSSYSNYLSLAENWVVGPMPKVQLSPRKEKRPAPVRPISGKLYDDDEEAAKIFKENLAKWEQRYPVIDVPAGAISVEKASENAMKACPVLFDPDQKPLVRLIRDFYLVTLYEYRRPKFAVTLHVAHIQVHARTGEVLGIQLREDLKLDAE